MKTERLLLRTIVETDLPHIFEGLSNPQVVKYYGVNFTSLKDTEEQMKWFTNLEIEETGKWWAICDRNNVSFYGAIGINNYSNVHKKAELGFWLLPGYWGKGFVSEAANAVLNYCFKILNLHRVEAFVELENVKSKSALLKLGFELEGIMKDCEIKNDQFISLAIFAKFNR